MNRILIAASATLVTLCIPAQAETKITQLSASIILLGEPAPAEAAARSEASRRDRAPDVLAGGERREAGAKLAEMPVAENEKTSAIAASPDDAGDSEAEPLAPLEDSGLRPGN